MGAITVTSSTLGGTCSVLVGTWAQAYSRRLFPSCLRIKPDACFQSEDGWFRVDSGGTRNSCSPVTNIAKLGKARRVTKAMRFIEVDGSLEGNVAWASAWINRARSRWVSSVLTR